MKAVEVIRHQLSLAIRVDDHFTGEPVQTELAVALSTGEGLVKSGGGGARHEDGTYRFIDLKPGARTVTVTAPDDLAFTWTPTTAVAIPLVDPRTPVVIELWPTPKARPPAGTLAIRARVDAPIASPVAAGQEVQMEVLSGFPPRNKRTRIDAGRELLFVIVGAMELTSDDMVSIEVAVPGRTVASVDVDDHGAVTSFTGNTFDVPPGGEIRAVINLS